MTEQLIGKRIDLLDKGWIELIDFMPHPATGVSGDLAIVNAARVSFLGESKGAEQDKKLLFYLLRNQHTSPFEMVEFKFRVHAPLLTWWQWARHRTWNFNAQCLSGETEITFNRPKTEAGGIVSTYRMRLKELYAQWHANRWNQAPLEQLHIRVLNEATGVFESSTIHDVYYTGLKPGFRVITADGSEVVCSKDHKFITLQGWQTLEDATGLTLEHKRAAWRELPEVCVIGKPLATVELSVADSVKLRDEFAAKKRQIGKLAEYLSPITKIEYIGEIEMYDIAVVGPHHNFLADGFVVHNSGRYTPFEEDDYYVPQVWRKQSKNNKQASEGVVDEEVNHELTEKLEAHYAQAFALYESALQAGVSKEMARLFLPGFSVYYTWVAKVDAHNLMHFLRLRMAADAQYEIRVYAEAIFTHFFKPMLPWTAEAFETYILKSE
jgi:thymidylate synthase ThyX